MTTVQDSSRRAPPENRAAGGRARGPRGAAEIRTLERIQDRLLWLSMNVIHHANHGRPNPEKSKVGGHPASCASALSILTALYFSVMEGCDRIAVKPHASPVMHAAMYLLGVLPRERLATLRQYGGLQAYPSRTKDPDAVDFSTGSVGLGAVAPTFAALVERYAHAHFGDTTARRFIAVSGDAELDEGNVWEAIIDESLQGLGNSLWVIDLNRQSLDRVVPGVRAARLQALFADSGWQVIETKYGARLQEAFARDGGAALRLCIDDMRNEEYQSLIRRDGPVIRAALTRGPRGGEIARCLSPVGDRELPSLLSNLGGHDLPELLRAFDRAKAERARPTVIFAYTIKGWRLPIAGDPFNHSALLGHSRLEELRESLAIDAGDPWAGFAPDSEEGACCRRAAERMGLVAAAASRSAAAPQGRPRGTPAVSAREVPLEIPSAAAGAAGAGAGAAGAARGITSTQEALGRALLRLGELPGVGERLVTASPDVSVSTGLAAWINAAGLFSLRPLPDFESGRPRVLDWNASPRGRHIELGISEMNLFTLLGQLGLSQEMNGQLLFPVGTVYDPFVCRGLDALIFGLYSGAKFICAGTPSGVSLSSEGGAHQSSVTAALGMELPALDYYEPCFAVEAEWALLEGVRQCCNRETGRCSYLRLSTKPVDQGLMEPALARLGRETLRAQAMAGGYLLHDPGSGGGTDREPLVHLVSCGAMIPETLAAAAYLEREGVRARVIHLVSPRRALEDWRRHRGGGSHVMARLLPAETRQAPVVTVIDGAASALGWVGSVFGQKTTPLGVCGFGQSGSRKDLYRCMQIDEESILEAAFAAVDDAQP
jgi:pyruvate dehydrogenase E1 component